MYFGKNAVNAATMNASEHPANVVQRNGAFRTIRHAALGRSFIESPNPSFSTISSDAPTCTSESFIDLTNALP